MNEYIYINTRVIAGVYASLYRRGSGYAVTDYSSGGSITYEFDTRSKAVAFRENLRKSK